MSIRTNGFKSILLSPETHARLAEMTNKTQIFNDVITELLNMKQNAIRSEHVLGEANTHSKSSTKGKGGNPKPNG